MKKTAKQILKEEFKKAWDWYKWGFYMSFVVFISIWGYIIIKSLFFK